MADFTIYTGIDIISIERINEAVSRSEQFKRNIFSKDEIEYCESRKHSGQHFAGRWCIKESIMKMMNKIGNFDHIRFRDIMVAEKCGVPGLRLEDDLTQLLETILPGRDPFYNISISITHDSSLDTAIGSCTLVATLDRQTP